MRIFRDDDEHDDEPHGHPRPDDIGAQANLLADEIEDFLCEAAEAADAALSKTETPLSAPLPDAAVRIAAPVEPITGEPAPAPIPAPVAKPHTRGRIWRAGAAGSSVVVGVAALAAWGQPAEVAVPVTVYGLGWLAYLSWHAARRPSPALALAAFVERRAARLNHNPR